jgi:hypothetical protein
LYVYSVFYFRANKSFRDNGRDGHVRYAAQASSGSEAPGVAWVTGQAGGEPGRRVGITLLVITIVLTLFAGRLVQHE